VHDCLDDDTLAGYADGSLGAEARAQVDEHVDCCHTCRRLLAAVGASADPPQPSGREEAGAQKRRA
jgi:anti-sigma factor RsiW